jgi:hypothetical protein
MKIHFAILALLAALFSCHENNKENFEKIDAYPTSAGIQWTYESQLQLKIYETLTSTQITDSDSATFLMHVKIEKDTILNDTMNVIKFTSLIENYSEPSTQYYFTDKDGLRAYAYTNGASHSFAKKNTDVATHTGLYPSNFFNPAPSGDENFYVFEPVSRLNLKLPLDVHSKWTYTTPFEPMNLQIDKEVIGYETVKTNNRTYNCYKVSWIYIENKYFDRTQIYDWIAKEGLIKRRVISDRIAFNVSETEPLSYHQITETILLKELILP